MDKSTPVAAKATEVEREDASDTLERCRDLVRTFRAVRRDWRIDSINLLKLMKTIMTNAAQGKTDDLRFNNKKIYTALVEDPFVQKFFLTLGPYARVHVVTEDTNEHVFRLRENMSTRCAELMSAMDKILREEESGDPWWESLSIVIKVVTPEGTELLGNFAPEEIVWDVNHWVARRRGIPLGRAVLGCAEATLDDDSIMLGSLDIDRRVLRFKLEGDLGKTRMEEVEARRRRDAEANRKKRGVDYAKRKQASEDARMKIAKDRENALAKFQDDRKKVDERVTREFRVQGAAASPSST